MDHASVPLQYRAIIDVAKIGNAMPADLSHLPYGFRPAIELAVMQSADGEWNNAMLSIPARGSFFAHIR